MGSGRERGGDRRAFKTALLPSPFHSRIPLTADPACRLLAFSVVLTDLERGTGYFNKPHSAKIIPDGIFHALALCFSRGVSNE